ncbi:MAG: endonuclease III domain-containing protein [Syntrophomonadaceae bacterium]|nr:endonuclease III domain-containing protein [Syntrophomonadaceae bacterium]
MSKTRERLMQIYNRLLDHFGPRHWWPARTQFEVIVGAILTQNVSWKNVEKAIQNLDRLGLLDPHRLLAASPEVIAEAVLPTRYYNQKAERLRGFCEFLVREYQGELSRLFSLDIKELRERLLALKGIGKETADSIILYAAEKPIFVVDAYTKRIFCRLGLLPEDAGYDQVQEFFMKHLPPETELYNEYHALIDALGNTLCASRKPRCTECPLADICGFCGETSRFGSESEADEKVSVADTRQ